jgi:hypothetical protein
MKYTENIRLYLYSFKAGEIALVTYLHQSDRFLEEIEPPSLDITLKPQRNMKTAFNNQSVGISPKCLAIRKKSKIKGRIKHGVHSGTEDLFFFSFLIIKNILGWAILGR